MASSNPSSPAAHFSLAGAFTPEDIQELLGAMAGEHQARAHPENSSMASISEPGNGVAQEDGLEDYRDIPEDSKAQARVERKRSREKKRRSDVNKKFADLTQLLRQIESEEAEEDASKTRLSFNPTNRVDLITRTIAHLERLRDQSKKRKLEIESLQQQLDQAKKAGEDTAAKLKEAMFHQPTGGKQQVCSRCILGSMCKGSLRTSFRVS